MQANIQIRAYQHLYQSFQDAVRLTCELDIRYLWANSLCSLRDDQEDLAREPAFMVDVCGNTTLPIATRRVAGCTEGFLPDCASPEHFDVDRHLRLDSKDATFN